MAYDITPTTGTGGITGVGTVGSPVITQSFTTVGAGSIGTVQVHFQLETDPPPDNVLLDLYASSGDEPAGSSLGQASIAGSSIDAGGSLKTFTFTPIAVVATTKYVYVLRRSGAVSNTTYAVADGTDSDVYAGGTKGQATTIDPNVGWSSQSQDLYFIITVDESGGGGTRDARKLTLLGVG